jgi:hypothetical protein
MRRYQSSKKYQGEKYLGDRNLLVSSATLRLTEEIKRKARRTQIKEEYKRRLRHTFRHTSLPRDQSTQTDNDQFTFLEDDISDTSTEDLIFVPDSDTGFCSIVTRTVTLCLTLIFTFITAIVICIFIGHYLRVYPLYSRL